MKLLPSILAHLVCLLAISTPAWGYIDLTAGIGDPFGSEMQPGEMPTSEAAGYTTDTALQEPTIRFRYTRPPWLGDRLSLAGNSEQEGGDYRGRLNLSANDLAAVNDSLALDYRRSLAGREGVGSRGFAMDYSFSSRFGRILVNGRVYEYETSTVTSGRKYQTRGDRQSVDMTARRNLFRGYGVRLETLMGVNTRESNTVSDGAGSWETSHHKSFVRLEGRLNCDLGMPNVEGFSSVAMERGLDYAGSEDGEGEESRDTAQYRKYTLLGSLSRPLGSWSWDLSGRYQYSEDVRPGTHQMQVAGPSLMSGFAGQGVYGSNGGWLRVDASSPWRPLALLEDTHSSLRLSFLRGWVSATDDRPDRHGSASAAEVALQLKTEGVTAGLRIGQMLAESIGTLTRPDVPDVSLTLSLNLD